MECVISSIFEFRSSILNILEYLSDVEMYTFPILPRNWRRENWMCEKNTFQFSFNLFHERHLRECAFCIKCRYYYFVLLLDVFLFHRGIISLPLAKILFCKYWMFQRHFAILRSECKSLYWSIRVIISLQSFRWSWRKVLYEDEMKPYNWTGCNKWFTNKQWMYIQIVKSKIILIYWILNQCLYKTRSRKYNLKTI